MGRQKKGETKERVDKRKGMKKKGGEKERV